MGLACLVHITREKIHNDAEHSTHGCAFLMSQLTTKLEFPLRYVSAFGPARVLSQRVSQCCVSLIWMVMQGEYTEVYPGSGKRRPYV
jgi:hypothetical protein